MWLWITGVVATYMLSAVFMSGVFSRYDDFFDGNDRPPAEVAGGVWPLTLICIGAFYVVRGIFRAGTKPVTALISPIYRLGSGAYRIGTRAPWRRRRKLPPSPKLLVEPGAQIEGVEQYRRLAGMVRDYEKNIPVTERER